MHFTGNNTIFNYSQLPFFITSFYVSDGQFLMDFLPHVQLTMHVSYLQIVHLGKAFVLLPMSAFASFIDTGDLVSTFIVIGYR